MSVPDAEQTHLLAQLQQVAQGIAETFAPFCEVVLHDLTRPDHAVIAIHNNLSGREPHQPATELGLARIQDCQYPQIIANYANRFADGRPAKSTSIGIKDSRGSYVAALCLNIDLTAFRSLQSIIESFVQLDSTVSVQESLEPAGAELLKAHMDQFAARRGTVPQALKVEDRRTLVKELKAGGHLQVRRAMEIVASHLGVSRAAAYSYAKHMTG